MSLEFLLASAIGGLAAGGFWLILRARSFDVILGLTLLSYAVNLFLFAAGRLNPGRTPLLKEGVAPLLANYTDPLPQALVLTAIVISMAMTALLLVMALRARAANGSDHIDGREPRA
jgi:multicomponent K+:H+ antiporter subunit C